MVATIITSPCSPTWHHLRLQLHQYWASVILTLTMHQPFTTRDMLTILWEFILRILQLSLAAASRRLPRRRWWARLSSTSARTRPSLPGKFESDLFLKVSYLLFYFTKYFDFSILVVSHLLGSGDLSVCKIMQLSHRVNLDNFSFSGE